MIDALLSAPWYQAVIGFCGFLGVLISIMGVYRVSAGDIILGLIILAASAYILAG